MGNNPSSISQPKLISPTVGFGNKGGGVKKEKKNKGNQPWVNARKKLRQSMFR